MPRVDVWYVSRDLFDLRGLDADVDVDLVAPLAVLESQVVSGRVLRFVNDGAGAVLAVLVFSTSLQRAGVLGADLDLEGDMDLVAIGRPTGRSATMDTHRAGFTHRASQPLRRR